VKKEDLFAKRPAYMVDLYHEIVAIVGQIGNFKEEAFIPDGIFLKTKTTFLTIKIKTKHLEIVFYLDHLENIHPVQKYRQTSKNRFAHVVLIDDVEDINQQLVEWIKASYDLIMLA
jgi:hypothetical protein